MWSSGRSLWPQRLLFRDYNLAGSPFPSSLRSLIVCSLGIVMALDGREDLPEIPNPLAAFGVPDAPDD